MILHSKTQEYTQWLIFKNMKDKWKVKKRRLATILWLHARMRTERQKERGIVRSKLSIGKLGRWQMGESCGRQSGTWDQHRFALGSTPLSPFTFTFHVFAVTFFLFYFIGWSNQKHTVVYFTHRKRDWFCLHEQSDVINFTKLIVGLKLCMWSM